MTSYDYFHAGFENELGNCIKMCSKTYYSGQINFNRQIMQNNAAHLV